MKEKQTRQSRYIRPLKEKLGRLELQPRDIVIVKTVYEYRFLRTDHLTALIKGDRTSTEKRLRKLWEHRYLERSFLPLIPGNEPATRKAIYSLDYQGANLLSKHEGIDPKHLKHTIRHNKPGHTYVEHQLMSSNFRAILTLALQKENPAKMLFWRQDKETRDRVEVKESKGKKYTLPIAPDGFFCIEDTRGKMFWFLESDRYTMDHQRWFRKIKAYYEWWEQNGHTKKFGIKNFRVLTICPNQATLERRVEVAKRIKIAQAGGSSIPIGSRIFWFVSEEDYSLEASSVILKNIFLIAKSKEEKKHKLLE